MTFRRLGFGAISVVGSLTAGCFTDSSTTIISDGGTADSNDDVMCIAAGTMVLTPDGERRIETLQVGEAVWSIDPETGERIAARITKIRSAQRECMSLSFAGGSLVCTSTHPLYDPAARAYADAGTWAGERARAGLLRVTDDGVEAIAVEAVQTFAGLRDVYDLTVDTHLHNFVAGGIVVHNKSPDECQVNPESCNDDGPSTTQGGGTTSGDAEGSSSIGPASSGSDSGGTAGTSTTDGADESTAACTPITEDASGIGLDCAAKECPPDYTCQPFNGIILQETCQILCINDCDCPMGTACEMVSDKGNTWMQCNQPA